MSNVSRFLTRIVVLTIMLESNNIWTQAWKIVFDIIFVYFVVLNWKEEIVLVHYTAESEMHCSRMPKWTVREALEVPDAKDGEFLGGTRHARMKC
jgi:hypothetical protein